MADSTAAPHVIQTGPAGAPQRDSRPLRRALVFCFGLPALAFAGSYVWLAVDNGQWNLWPVVVHESGRYTLAGTVFYFSHFLREVPTVLAYGLFLLGMSGATRGTLVPRNRARYLVLVAALLLVVVAFWAAARSDGLRSAAYDLLQFRTRDDEAAYGSHWRYHLLSTLWFGLVAATLPWGMHRLQSERLRLVRHSWWTRVAWIYFVGLTAAFGVTPDVLLDTRFAGHQAREIFTHATTTLPLGIGVLLALGSAGSSKLDRANLRDWIPLIGVVWIPVMLAAAALAGDVMEAGQSSLGLAPMVAGHYFEHTLDQVLLVLVIAGGAGMTRTETRTSP